MAASPAHKLGQVIGDTVEAAIEPLLRKFARKHGLYLDRKGIRPARRGTKVTWTDAAGNKHDLDYVLERGGSAAAVGSPAAFIETMWRRYTKHSRNKAQEIQGALLPLKETYHADSPFIGAVLAGVFTEGALVQLRSLGFVVLHFPLLTVVKAFKLAGIDVQFDEDTPTEDLAAKAAAAGSLSPQDGQHIARNLVRLNRDAVRTFMAALERAVTRRIDAVRVLALHGSECVLSSVEDAISFIAQYGEGSSGLPVVAYEVQVRYTNGDSIDGRFASKESAIAFLRSIESPRPL